MARGRKRKFSTKKRRRNQKGAFTKNQKGGFAGIVLAAGLALPLLLNTATKLTQALT